MGTVAQPAADHEVCGTVAGGGDKAEAVCCFARKRGKCALYRILTCSLFVCVCALQTCQVGLNFANEEETKRFRSHVNELVGRRQRKTGTH